MIKNTINQASRALLAQDDQLKKGNNRLMELHSHLESATTTYNKNCSDLDALEDTVAALLAEQGLDPNLLDQISVTEEDLPELDALTSDAITETLPNLKHIATIDTNSNWNDYIKNADQYIETHQLRTDLDPILQILPPSEVARLEREFDAQFGSVKWTKWDYAVVFLSAGVATLTDYFLVSLPSNMTFKGVSYSGSPLTKFIRSQEKSITNAPLDGNDMYSWLHNAQNNLEKFAKVPYDYASNRSDILGTNVKGLNPHSHRLQSFGHDPILGFFFGIRDIMNGEMTVVGSDGKLQVIDRPGFDQKNIFEAFTLQVAHLLSDIPTSAGLPAPFLSILQCINGKSPFSLGPSGEKVSYNDAARFMYKHGYTLDHYLTMSITPMLIELIIHTYYKLANFETLFLNKEQSLKTHTKLKSMLCLAHSLASAGTIGKSWLLGWNPAAINIAQLVKCMQSFYALYKAKVERYETIDQHLLQEWQKISSATL